MNKKLKTCLNVVSIVVVSLVCAIALIMVMLSFSKAKDGIPRIFGVTTVDILTDSMAGTIDPGDLAVIRKTDVSALAVGDVITFKTFVEEDGLFKQILNTHQIVRIDENGYFVTKGTNAPDEDARHVPPADVVGKYRFRLRGMGYAVRFLQSWYGFLFVIILPLTLFFAYRVYVVIKLIVQFKREKKRDAVSQDDYEKLKRELEELRARVDADSADAPRDREL